MIYQVKKHRNLGLLLCLVIGLTSATEPEKVDQDWRVNFPKQVEYCEQIPSPDSLLIFLMAGQSNMAGRGFVAPEDTIPNRRILTLDPSMKWIYAKEPLHFYEPRMTGLDCGMSFANQLLADIPEGYSIAMIPCAIGGSAIEKWLYNKTFRGVALLDNFKSKAEFVKPYGQIKGILWHQGESNSRPERRVNYDQKLDSLITIFRATVGDESLPVLLGELGHCAQPASKQVRWDALTALIHTVADQDENIAVVGTQGLMHKGDSTHFDSPSQRELGKRFALKYLELTSTPKD